ncbi:HIRAN domain-containing protein [Sphingobium sp. CFD-2]|uniref:HIRAN domain-containing protein n=1 Tax=Sphingobium sp. CFD-2 TaxID=2878542 RepID=UPI00214D110B|nr:HIRAN domain-containing protein [Sphingobium sp. CFD-2]
MLPSPASIAIVGADLPTGRAARRRAEIAACRPGERLEFRREPGMRAGKRIVGVYSPRGVQIGYVLPAQVDRVAGLVSIARAIFEREDSFGAVARATFDGSAPSLPQPAPSRRIEPPREPVDEYCDIFPARAAG